MAVTLSAHEPLVAILARIPTTKLNTIEEVLQLIVDQELNDEIDRYRSSYLYRGMPDVSYGLLTTLQRN